jgi:GDP-4-dehydro-6-deoxy-D-mannose reductase
MFRRILVTGAAGFVGRHLLAFLQGRSNVRVYGVTRFVEGVSEGWFAGDLTEESFVDDVLREVKPNVVIHLAAQSSVADSWRDPRGTVVNNVVAQLNLLESIVRHAPSARVLTVGSAEEYGHLAPENLPAREDGPLRPDNPYALSKIAQDYLGLQYHLGRHLDVVRIRPFNLFGPGQSDRFAVGSFARQIAEAEAGLGEPVLRVGNMTALRDYTDVRDAARAYWAILERGRAGEVYNLGGGGIHSIGEVLDALVQRARVPLEVRQDPAKFRPVDAPVVAPDVGRLHEETGWQPTIPFEQTIQDLLDDWRIRVAQPAGRLADTN